MNAVSTGFVSGNSWCSKHIDVLLRTTTVHVFFLGVLTSCNACRQILGTFIYIVGASALVFVCVGTKCGK